MDHFTVVGLVTWLLNGSEAGVDLVSIQTSLLLLCKSSCFYANKLAFTREKLRGLYQSKVTSSLACIHGQVTKHSTVKWPIVCNCNLFTHGASRSSEELIQKCLCIPGSNWNLEMLVFKERGKPEYPEKNLSEQSREPTTNLTHL